jgi:uncharacterized protein (TIGR03083 family)
MSIDYIAAIRSNTDALADAAKSAGIDAQVPSCPEWSVSDLLGHMGTVHRWAAMNLDRDPGAEFMRSRDAGIDVPDPAARIEWVREGGAALADALAARSPDDPAWTWAPPHTVRFWHRRQAHETAMHRVDAELAAGAPGPIDAELAADGIDELLGIVDTRPWLEPIRGEGESLHFHCTDVDGEWTVRLEPDAMLVAREHAKGDVALRGPASALLCWMQGRGPIDALEAHGDRGLLDRWREVATF